MTAGRMLPLMLIAALAAACSKTPTQAAGPLTTTSSPTAASAMPLLSAQQGADPVDPGCASVVGTFYGPHEADGWRGTLYLSSPSIADGSVQMPSFWDRGIAGTHRAHGSRGMFSGEETNTITFSDGSFDIHAKYNAQPAGTPGLFVLHETGKITNGSGAFAGVSGHVAVDGPFTIPPDGNLQWIAAMHGSICGLQ